MVENWLQRCSYSYYKYVHWKKVFQPDQCIFDTLCHKSVDNCQIYMKLCEFICYLYLLYSVVKWTPYSNINYPNWGPSNYWGPLKTGSLLVCDVEIFILKHFAFISHCRFTIQCSIHIVKVTELFTFSDDFHILNWQIY